MGNKTIEWKEENNCLITDNKCMLDHRITLASKGIDIIICSQPGERLTLEELSRLGKENKETTKKYLDELIRYGYVKEIRCYVRNDEREEK